MIQRKPDSHPDEIPPVRAMPRSEHGALPGLTWFHDRKEFGALKPEWDKLAATEVQTIFLTHDWLESWLDVYGAGGEPWVLVARDEDGVLAGVVPLMLRHGPDRLRRLEFIGAGEVTPNHLDIIARPDRRDDVLRGLAESLRDSASRWDMVELDKLPEESNTPERLASYLGEMGMTVKVEDSATCPYVELPGSFEEYVKNLGSSTRNNLRLKKNRLKRNFQEVRISAAETPEEVERALSALIEMHQARWTARGYTGAFSTGRFVEFHRKVSMRALLSGQLRLYSLEVDSTPAAVQYAFRAGDRVQMYLVAFGDRWADYSPGMLTIFGAIERSIEEGAREYDLLEGDEPYKHLLGTRARRNVRLRVYSPSPRGQAARFRVEATATLMGWAVRYVPVRVRRPLWLAVQRFRVAAGRG